MLAVKPSYEKLMELTMGNAYSRTLQIWSLDPGGLTALLMTGNARRRSNATTRLLVIVSCLRELWVNSFGMILFAWLHEWSATHSPAWPRYLCECGRRRPYALTQGKSPTIYSSLMSYHWLILSGPVCVDYSMMGKRMQEEGSSFPVHRAFYEHVDDSTHDVVVIENVPEYKESTVKEILGSSWTLMSSRVDPRSLGFGCARQSLWKCFLFLLKESAWWNVSHLSKLPGHKKLNFFGEPFYVLPKS